MKNIVFCSLFLLSAALGFSQDKAEISSIEILPGSSISIKGDAKIATFTCHFDIDQLEAPASISYEEVNSQYIFNDAELVLRNRGFDCGRESRNEDFHEMVKTEQYPEMRITLRQASLNNEKEASATVDIFIAGKENSYTIPVEIVEDDVPRFRGGFELNIRDFDLEPIKKMFGLIRVQDIIDIRFDLRIRY